MDWRFVTDLSGEKLVTCDRIFPWFVRCSVVGDRWMLNAAKFEDAVSINMETVEGYLVQGGLRDFRFSLWHVVASYAYSLHYLANKCRLYQSGQEFACTDRSKRKGEDLWFYCFRLLPDGGTLYHWEGATSVAGFGRRAKWGVLPPVTVAYLANIWQEIEMDGDNYSYF